MLRGYVQSSAGSGSIRVEVSPESHLVAAQARVGRERPHRSRWPTAGSTAAKRRIDVYVPIVLYSATMKRLQIYIEEAADEELARRAVREGTSKAALIRSYVAERLGPDRATRDPLDALVGRYDAESGSINELVYGP